MNKLLALPRWKQRVAIAVILIVFPFVMAAVCWTAIRIRVYAGGIVLRKDHRG